MDKQNEMITELTPAQMEKVSGGGATYDPSDGLPAEGDGLNCFYCSGTQLDGTPCGKPLEQVSGTLYRCTNPKCRKFTLDQYPTV